MGLKTTNWRELITDLYETRVPQAGIATKPKFYPAASAERIADAETQLDAKLPEALGTLFLETDGVMDMLSIDGGEWSDNMWLVWTLSEIVEENIRYRKPTEAATYGHDFQKVVFFANAGSDGILFGFPVVERGLCAPDVTVWHPIEDEVEAIASSLEDFLRGWLTSTIFV